MEAGIATKLLWREKGRSCKEPIRKEELMTSTNGDAGELQPMRVEGPQDTWVGELSAETKG
jgi:hypothetical protein